MYKLIISFQRKQSLLENKDRLEEQKDMRSSSSSCIYLLFNLKESHKFMCFSFPTQKWVALIHPIIKCS